MIVASIIMVGANAITETAETAIPTITIENDVATITTETQMSEAEARDNVEKTNKTVQEAYADKIRAEAEQAAKADKVIEAQHNQTEHEKKAQEYRAEANQVYAEWEIAIGAYLDAKQAYDSAIEINETAAAEQKQAIRNVQSAQAELEIAIRNEENAEAYVKEIQDKIRAFELDYEAKAAISAEAHANATTLRDIADSMQKELDILWEKYQEEWLPAYDALVKMVNATDIWIDANTTVKEATAKVADLISQKDKAQSNADLARRQAEVYEDAIQEAKDQGRYDRVETYTHLAQSERNKQANYEAQVTSLNTKIAEAQAEETAAINAEKEACAKYEEARAEYETLKEASDKEYAVYHEYYVKTVGANGSAQRAEVIARLAGDNASMAQKKLIEWSGYFETAQNKSIAATKEREIAQAKYDAAMEISKEAISKAKSAATNATIAEEACIQANNTFNKTHSKCRALFDSAEYEEKLVREYETVYVNNAQNECDNATTNVTIANIKYDEAKKAYDEAVAQLEKIINNKNKTVESVSVETETTTNTVATVVPESTEVSVTVAPVTVDEQVKTIVSEPVTEQAITSEPATVKSEPVVEETKTVAPATIKTTTTATETTTTPTIEENNDIDIATIAIENKKVMNMTKEEAQKAIAKAYSIVKSKAMINAIGMIVGIIGVIGGAYICRRQMQA